MSLRHFNVTRVVFSVARRVALSPFQCRTCRFQCLVFNVGVVFNVARVVFNVARVLFNVARTVAPRWW